MPEIGDVGGSVKILKDTREESKQTSSTTFSPPTLSKTKSDITSATQHALRITQSEVVNPDSLILNEIDDHLESNIQKILKDLDNLNQELSVLGVTWNMARKPQTIDFNMLVPNPEDHEIIALSF